MTLLHRVCPEHNMARFYALSLERSLFGEFVVIRLWGRIGRRGRSISERFDAEPDAERHLGKLADLKRRRGYVDYCH
jgi:predicted DNA-binding WGR domain protein